MVRPKLYTFRKEKTKLVRIPVGLINEIRKKLPTLQTDSQRFATLYDTSLIKHSDAIDKMGVFLYGKFWKKSK